MLAQRRNSRVARSVLALCLAFLFCFSPVLASAAQASDDTCGNACCRGKKKCCCHGGHSRNQSGTTISGRACPADCGSATLNGAASNAAATLQAQDWTPTVIVDARPPAAESRATAVAAGCNLRQRPPPALLFA
jgi:hypothetical protein